MNICVIPARGGSKRIPRKNIRDVCGQPMITWSIQAAQQAGCFDRIIVSTDDQAIASIATEFGAEIPFQRPFHLADDHTTTKAVMAHAIDWLNSHGMKTKKVCCLYATAPFVEANDLRAGADLLESCAQGTFVFSATRYRFPIQRAIRIDCNGRSSMFQQEHAITRSQDMEDAFHDAGQFYWARPEAWMEDSIIFEGGRPIVIPHWRVQDIDNEEDWTRAELMQKFLSHLH
jgi:N-acylneuraminate cytidylyltransferase